MLRKRLNAGETLLGSWLQLPGPLSARVMAAQGFDWLAIDCEHGAFDLAGVPAVFGQVHAHGAGAVARLPAADGIWIRRVLDCGADGIIVPMVKSAKMARDIVRQAKYPPLGERGFGFSLANEYGQRFAAYAERANEELLVIAQIEHIDAVRDIDDIVAVEGIDGVIIGPYDLSGSMGLVGQVDHPEVQGGGPRARGLPGPPEGRRLPCGIRGTGSGPAVSGARLPLRRFGHGHPFPSGGRGGRAAFRARGLVAWRRAGWRHPAGSLPAIANCALPGGSLG
jgi:2-dehydro-3-deoxyglucarate aldolase